MPKRYTVALNLPNVRGLIKKKCRSNIVFCEMMGKEDRPAWVSDWLRGKNLPSPEEAARMCILLNTTPEEILLHEDKDEKETAKCQKDIELVRKLLEKEKGIKETPDPKIEGYSELQQAAIQFVLSLPPDKLERFVKMGRAAFEDN
jgi:transcriptional regulator with XRE-family HTH domain|nr:MAG TPA: SOS-response transcriptional repressor [Caudoviricetes sp.]